MRKIVIMPEGPSIVILKELVQPFIGKKVLTAEGNTKKVDLTLLQDEVIQDFKTWGKNFFICFKEFSVRVHFMLFGSYRINEHKATPARLSLQFKDEELNFYACSVELMEEPLDKLYDWSADVMSKSWDSEKAKVKIRNMPDELVCDVLLNQNVFAGVGNIIKNEVLFRIQVHPESRVGKLPAAKLDELVKEAVIYSYQFYEWKKEFTLKKHWLAHTKSICPRDNIPFKKAKLGKSNRRSFYCPECQTLFV